MILSPLVEQEEEALSAVTGQYLKSRQMEVSLNPLKASVKSSEGGEERMRGDVKKMEGDEETNEKRGGGTRDEEGEGLVVL